jgi:5-amino-6-(5-phosphoribosylamino)uracil reductase
MPYVLLSCAASIDGYIDDVTENRLLFSNDADFDRVDEVRAGCDAILVGATTIRRDDPRLLVRSPERRKVRISRGLPATPAKVTLTRRGGLDPAARFFTAGDTTKIVYAAPAAVDDLRRDLDGLAEVVDGGDPLVLERILDDLGRRGVGRLMVEGGGSIHTQFLAAGLADELHLVIAPFFVGDARAPRFVGDGPFPWRDASRARLIDVMCIDDVALLRYALSQRCDGA